MMRSVVLAMGCVLLFVSVLWAQDISGEYEVSIRGTNIFLDVDPAQRPISDETTLDIEQTGEKISATFGSFAGASAATLFKGKVGNDRFCAVWWYQGAPHETKLIWGTVSGDGRTLKGTFMYPRAAYRDEGPPGSQRLVPGWVEAKFTARKKLTPVTGIVRPDIRLRVQEDCISFDYRNAEVKRVNGNWKIVEGSHWLMDFGNNADEARLALRVIKRYRMDSRCFVGRPDPSMEYMLVNGKAPQGNMPVEDCLAFNPGDIEVKEINRRWKIVQGSRWLMDFETKEDEAKKAFSIIKMHGFDQICYIGRPDPSMTYLRK